MFPALAPAREAARHCSSCRRQEAQGLEIPPGMGRESQEHSQGKSPGHSQGRRVPGPACGLSCAVHGLWDWRQDAQPVLATSSEEGLAELLRGLSEMMRARHPART